MALSATGPRQNQETSYLVFHNISSHDFLKELSGRRNASWSSSNETLMYAHRQMEDLSSTLE